MVTVIGLDVGHSAVKMVVRGTNPFRTCFPSLVCSAIEIPGDTRAEQTAQDTVTVGEASFFVGETAYFQRDRHNSGSEMGLHAEWVSTAQYEALVRGALKKAELAGNDLSQVIIINGLPQANLANTKNNLDALIKRVAPQAIFKTLSQPMGAFYTEMLDQLRGKPRPSGRGRIARTPQASFSSPQCGVCCCSMYWRITGIGTPSQLPAK